MNSRSVPNTKRAVKEFRNRFHLKNVTYTCLCEVFKEQGFTVIEFNPLINEEDISIVIHNLGLDEFVKHEKGFLYTDQNYRLVFVNEKLTDEEKTLVLAHEEGHYFCGHTLHSPRIGLDVQEEYEANEFVHYLMEKTHREKIRKFVGNHRKAVIAGTLSLALIGGGSVTAKQYHDWKLYEGTYYVTVSGEKYHLKECVTIQGHKTRRLTKADVESGRYEACSVCMPDRN